MLDVKFYIKIFLLRLRTDYGSYFSGIEFLEIEVAHAHQIYPWSRTLR